MTKASQPDLASPGTMPAADTAQSPIARCIDLLRSMVAAGKELAAGLQNRLKHQSEANAPLGLLEAGDRRMVRMIRAIAYAVTLIAKLRADPAYRGEPSHTSQTARSPYCRERLDTKLDRHIDEDLDDTEPPYRRMGRHKPFERLFAGMSLSQIIERIRRDLGLCTPLGPWCETILDAPQPDPDPPPKPLIALTRRRWRATMLVPRSARRAQSDQSRRATGPP